MSKINYQFSPLPIEWLISQKLSATEKVVLGVLIALSNRSGFCDIGYEKLSGYCCVKSRTYLIQIINRLESYGYIERFIETGRNHASKIRVRLEILGRSFQAGEEESFLKDSSSEQKESDLKSERVCFNEKKSLFEQTQTIFKQDLNYNKEKSLFEQTEKNNFFDKKKESADVAADLSMPNAGQAGENNQQRKVCDDDAAAKIQAIKSYFGDKMTYVDILEISNKIAFRVGWNTLSQKISGIDINAAKQFAALHDVFFADSNTRYANERKIA